MQHKHKINWHQDCVQIQQEASADCDAELLKPDGQVHP